MEYTQYTMFNIKKENHPKLSQICSYGIFPGNLRTSSKQPSLFEPLKFYCIFTAVTAVLRLTYDVQFCKGTYSLFFKVYECLHIFSPLLQRANTYMTS